MLYSKYFPLCSNLYICYDASTTSNQFATTSSGNVNKSTKVDNKGGDPTEGELKVRAKDVPKKKAMKKEPKKEDKGKKKKRKVDESDSDDDIEIIHVDQIECRALNQQIPPKNFMNTVLKDLPKSYRAAIRKIGFGGFLDLDLDSHKSMFFSKLVSSFDYDRVSLVLERNQEIEITPVDIHLVYGLPMGGEIIKEPRQEEDEEWVEFIRRWRSCFGISGGSPSNFVIIYRIEELKKKLVCDEFIWHFVVPVVNCCIESTANPTLNYKFLYNCMDTKKIECWDWCEYVYRSLKSSIVEWQGGSAFFTGPLHFLMICYFDRLERFKISNPRQFPLRRIC